MRQGVEEGRSNPSCCTPERLKIREDRMSIWASAAPGALHLRLSKAGGNDVSRCHTLESIKGGPFRGLPVARRDQPVTAPRLSRQVGFEISNPKKKYRFAVKAVDGKASKQRLAF